MKNNINSDKKIKNQAKERKNRIKYQKEKFEKLILEFPYICSIEINETSTKLQDSFRKYAEKFECKTFFVKKVFFAEFILKFIRIMLFRL